MSRIESIKQKLEDLYRREVGYQEKQLVMEIISDFDKIADDYLDLIVDYNELLENNS